MIIYRNTKGGFIDDVRNGVIGRKVLDAFIFNGIYHNNHAEYRSWENSLRCMRDAIDDSYIADDCRVAIEYKLPLAGKRIDFLMDNYGFGSSQITHVLKDEENKYDHDNLEFFAVVTPLGVFFCERERDFPDVIVYNTYLPQEMLRKEQNRKIAIEYFKVYCEEYMKRNATNAEMVKNQYEQLILTSTLEHWSIDKFIDESNKYMDEHPLYVI